MNAVTRTQVRLATAILAVAFGICWLIVVPREKPKDPREVSISMDDYEVSTEPGYLCLGYAEDKKSWANFTGACPKGFAYLSNQDPAGSDKQGRASRIPLHGNCCKLPFEDILTDNHVYNVLDKCPDNSVATGTNVDRYGQCTSNCGMRCTFINTDRYRLGDEQPAAYWKDERSGAALYGQGDSELAGFEDIPLALRYGVGREAHGSWDRDGCVGNPVGSLLVHKETKECSGFFYRTLFYKDGTPVKMFPHCDAISDKYDPNAKCLVKKRSVDPKP